MPIIKPDPYSRRVVLAPTQHREYQGFAQRTGLLTGLAGASIILSLRNPGPTPVVINKFSFGFTTTTAFGTPQLVDFGLYKVRAYTVDASGGVSWALTGGHQKRNSETEDFTSITVCQVADTAAITAGTAAPDDSPQCIVSGWSGAAGTTIPMTTLLTTTNSEMPIVMNAEEGIYVRSITGFGASGVGRAYVQFDIIE